MAANTYRKLAYHSHMPKWRGNRSKPTGFKVGVELEMTHREGFSKILEALPEFQRNRPITESDGSLPYHTGVEIVFPPYSIGALKDKRSNFHRAISAVAASGAAPTEECGMHLNINTVDWSTKKKHLFVTLIATLPTHIIEKVGGRRLSFYCGPIRWSYASPLENLWAFCYGSHANLLSTRANRIEARYPNATLSLDVINFNVYFLRCVERFALKLSSSSKDYLTVRDLLEDANDSRLLLLEFVQRHVGAGKNRTKLINILKGG